MAHQPEIPVHDPLIARKPTSHEQMTGQPWNASYQSDGAPWDIGHPQPAFARLAAAREVTGTVLDAGCGTGEHALLFAALGLPVLGVDVAETALATARAKAAARKIHADFATADAFHLERLGCTFETVLDCGLFHTFNAEERSTYVASLGTVTEPGAMLYVLCFSDEGTNLGPHPISRPELQSAFNVDTGWEIGWIEPDHIQTRFHNYQAAAWFAKVRRL